MAAPRRSMRCRATAAVLGDASDARNISEESTTALILALRAASASTSSVHDGLRTSFSSAHLIFFGFFLVVVVAPSSSASRRSTVLRSRSAPSSSIVMAAEDFTVGPRRAASSRATTAHKRTLLLALRALTSSAEASLFWSLSSKSTNDLRSLPPSFTRASSAAPGSVTGASKGAASSSSTESGKRRRCGGPPVKWRRAHVRGEGGMLGDERVDERRAGGREHEDVDLAGLNEGP